MRRPASPFTAVYCAGVSTAFFEAAAHVASRRRRDSGPWLCLFLRPTGLAVANERYDGNLGWVYFSITLDCQGEQRILAWLKDWSKTQATCITERICDVAKRAQELAK